MRCWLCGAEALNEVDTSALGSPFQTRVVGMWPPVTDHQHAAEPPTPGELEQAGHEALSRIRELG